MAEVRMAWTFTPEDYFEDPVDLEVNGFRFEIQPGRVVGRLPHQEPTAALCEEAHRRLSAAFASAQLIELRQFALSEPGSVARIDEDGDQAGFVFPKCRVATFSVGRIDARTVNQGGEVVIDTRADRIRLRAEFARMAIANVDDPTANLIVRSYAIALTDRANEFFYLYDVRDALEQRFTNAEGARKALGMSGNQWSDFGRITCREPLKQGRHRGEHAGALRDATQEELDTVRGLAREMILGYFAWLRAHP